MIKIADSLTKEDSLDDIMIQALLLQRVNFIELLVVNGFVMKNFLTVNKLAILYNEAVSHIRVQSAGTAHMNNSICLKVAVLFKTVVAQTA